MTQKWLADFLTGIWIYIIGVQEWLDRVWQELQDSEGRERVLGRVKAHFREYVVYYVFAVVLFVVMYGLWSYERDGEDGEDIGMAKGSSQGKVKKMVMTGGGANGSPNEATVTRAGPTKQGVKEPTYYLGDAANLITENDKQRFLKIKNEKERTPAIEVHLKTKNYNGTQRAVNLADALNPDRKILLSKRNSLTPQINIIRSTISPVKQTQNLSSGSPSKGKTFNKQLKNVLAKRNGSPGGSASPGQPNKKNQIKAQTNNNSKGSASTVPAPNPQVPVNVNLPSGPQGKLPTSANAASQAGGVVVNIKPKESTEMGTDPINPTTSETGTSTNNPTTQSQTQTNPTQAKAQAQTPTQTNPTLGQGPGKKKQGRRQRPPGQGKPVSQLQARASAGAQVSVTVINPPAAPAPAPTNNKAPKPAKEPEANQQPGPAKPQQGPAQGQTSQRPQQASRKDQGAEGVRQAVEAALAKKGQKDAKKQDKKQETQQIKEQASQLGEQFKRKSPGSKELNQLMAQVKQGVGQQVDRIGGILFSLLTVLGLTAAAGTAILERTGYDPAKKVIRETTSI